MKIKSYLFCGILFLLISGCQSIDKIKWVSSNADSQWTIQPSITKNSDSNSSAEIIIDPSKTLQVIDGFGGSFNELGWEALQLINENERDSVISALFDPVEGCNFNVCRVPIGANDYALDWYSHNSTPDDFEMKNFSIDRDKIRLLPYIHKAMQKKSDLKVWGSPWSPPAWMKTNNHYACRSKPEVNDLPVDRQGEEMVNQIITEDRYLKAYALYFSRFIKAYKNEGVDLYAVHVQNEPNSCQNFPSCIWTPEALSTFIGEYLGPHLLAEELDTEIWLGTIERPHPERVDPVLQDIEAKKFIKGVGFQWAGKGVIPFVNENYPDLKLMQTETECGNGSNDWKALEHTFQLMNHYFRNGANSYMYWNFVLDHTGSSQWGWKQNSMITINELNEVVYNPEYFLMKHFSSFIQPGAKFVPQDGDKNCLAFLNADNTMVIIYYNEDEKDISKSFKVGEDFFNVSLPSKSIHTFVLNI